MRVARIKVLSDEGPGTYHAMSRTVNGERLFDNVAKEVFRKMIWQIADYTGVQVLTYAILDNHFHVLLSVPQRTPVSDEELLRRFRVLYPRPTRYESRRLEAIKSLLRINGPEAAAWRKQQLALMGDLSQYMKLLKQRFTRWFNCSHRRYGTLWSERFKSILLEPKARTIEAVAAYIDLNCVRAILAQDPKDYRFCGYAEAVGGSALARAGIQTIYGPSRKWHDIHAQYRQVLFGTGREIKERAGRVTQKAFEQVLREGGKLPLATALRCRVRYFTDGAVLGSQAFVNEQLGRYRRRTGAGQRMRCRHVPDIAPWGELATLRQLRA